MCQSFPQLLEQSICWWVCHPLWVIHEASKRLAQVQSFSQADFYVKSTNDFLKIHTLLRSWIWTKSDSLDMGSTSKAQNSATSTCSSIVNFNSTEFFRIYLFTNICRNSRNKIHLTFQVKFDEFDGKTRFIKSIDEKKYWLAKKVLINTNTKISKSIENNQYKYFWKVLKIQIVLMVKGLFLCVAR